MKKENITTDEILANDNLYIDYLGQRLEKNSKDREALLHKAIMLFITCKDFDTSRVIFLSLIEEYPDFIDAYLWFGEFQLFGSGDAGEAIRYLKKAVEIAPHRADCYALLAGALERSSSTVPEMIEYHYRKSFELEPTYINPRCYLAFYFFYYQKKFKEARHELEEALKYIRDDEWPTNNPVERYYEDMITGRLYGRGKKEILDFIKEIDEAEAAAKLGTKE